jgi:hypothetical protein
MTTFDWISIFAIVLGPILAVQAQKFLERIRERKDRREAIFKTLMATRGAQLSLQHVEALNRIDLEFPKTGKFRKVNDAWQQYFDHLADHEYGKDNQTRWTERQSELLTELLKTMGESINYNFTRVEIKRNIYSPTGHYQLEDENRRIREALLKIFEGQQRFPVELISSEPTEEQVKSKS